MMTTAKEFASAAANMGLLATQFKPDDSDPYSAAANMGLLATQFKPDDSDPYRQVRELIRYHLLSASNHAREIAEALAAKEAQG